MGEQRGRRYSKGEEVGRSERDRDREVALYIHSTKKNLSPKAGAE